MESGIFNCRNSKAVSLAPTPFTEIQLLNLINIIKTKTARFARRDCPEILNQYYYKPYFWTDSYFVSTVGTNKKIIDEYINNQ